MAKKKKEEILDKEEKKTRKKRKKPLENEETLSSLLESPKRKKKKWVNPHKRNYGIEIIKNQSWPILYKVSIDIGFRSAGMTLYNTKDHTLKCLNYKKDKECQVKGMRIVELIKLCEETLKKYLELLPIEVKNNLEHTQFILEEPLVIMSQKSFSISLYLLLAYMIKTLIEQYDVHSIILVQPGSAKRLLGFKHNEKMPDSEKTKFCKEHLSETGVKNNHQSDSLFSMILTNQEELKEYYSCIDLLKNVDYEVYESTIEGEEDGTKKIKSKEEKNF